MSPFKSLLSVLFARQSAALSGRELDGLRQRADAARDEGQWAGAARLYREAATQSTEPFDLWVQCGNCSKEARDYEGADEAYSHALSLKPQNSDLHLQMGHLCKLQSKIEEAKEHYLRSFEIDANVHAERELQEMSRPPLEISEPHVEPSVRPSGLFFATTIWQTAQQSSRSIKCPGEELADASLLELSAPPQ